MNKLQVAKVVHAAVSALDETLGKEEAKKWEELPEKEQSEKLNKQYSTTAKATEEEKLKTRIAKGINDAFAAHDEEITDGNDLQSTGREETSSTDIDAIKADNELKRQAKATEAEEADKQPETAEEANASADQKIEEHNS